MRRSTWLRTAVIAAFVAGTSALPAMAADMLSAPPPPPPMAPPPALIDAGGGFYLRGDLGVGVSDFARIDTTPPLAGLTTVDSSINATGILGVGAGYAFNSWLRADVTAEYRFDAKHRHVDRYVGGGNLITGNVGGFVGLVNGYVDLGTWHRITPFVGAGVGMASLTMSGTRDLNIVSGGTVTGADKTETRFVWALHAGLGYDLTSNWKAEVGYRYMHFGDVKSGSVACVPAGPACPYQVRIKDLSSHDLRFGMRYIFADAAPAYSPGPLMRKY